MKKKPTYPNYCPDCTAKMVYRETDPIKRIHIFECVKCPFQMRQKLDEKLKEINLFEFDWSGK